MLKRWIARTSADYTSWTWPNMLLEGSCEAQIAALGRLYGSHLPLSIDIENDRQTGALELVGVGNTEEVVVLEWPIKSSELYVTLATLLGSDKPKVMQNGQHDVLTLEKHGLTVKNFAFDTLLAHAVVAPQLPHRLGIIAACELCAPRWKSKVENYKEYNGQDVAGTALLQEPLQDALDATHNGQALFDEYMALNDIAIKMRRRGVLVDKDRLNRHRGVLWQRLARAQADFHHYAPHVDLGKSGQTNSAKDFFFEELKCTPLRYTDEGEPSLDALTLKDFCSGPYAELARMLLKFRQAAKLLSTYVDGLPIDEDNLVHIIWKVYGTVTGRWSSQKPNGQNIPKRMRDVFVAREKKYVVSADFSQLEIRIAALLAGCVRLLEAFASGQDVHQMVGLRLFSGDAALAKRYRTQIKNGIYAYVYGADVVTAWKNMIVKAPDARLPMVRRIFKFLDKEYPELKASRVELLRKANENNYVEEPLSGRREYFHDGRVDYNIALNFEKQATAGTIMNRAIRAVDSELRWDKGEAILFQVHDELNIEVEDPERGADILRRAMEQEVELAGQRTSFPVNISAGKDWYNLRKVA
jgi:DNA polymerase-1